MGRRRRRKGTGASNPPDLNEQLETFLRAQFSPALEAHKAQLSNPRSQVVLLPRTTQHLSQSERIRRTLAYGRQKPSDTISYTTLRAIARFSLVNAAIHSRRRAQIRSVSRRYDGRRYKPGWSIVHVNHFDREFDASSIPDLTARIARVAPLIEKPHPKFDNDLSSLLVKLVEDHLTVDRMVVNTLRGKAPSSNSANPYPTIQMAHVDGASLWPADLYLDHFLRLNGLVTPGGVPNIELGLQHFKREYEVDMRDVAWIQVDNMHGQEAPLAFLSDRDVHVVVTNPSPEMHQYGFGLSPAETSYIAASLYLHGISYVATFFRDAFSEMVGILAGPQYEKADAQALADVLRTHHSGIGMQHNTPILKLAGQPGDLQFQPTRSSSARDMEFADTMHRASVLIHAHYGMDPSETFTDSMAPSSPASLQAPDRQAQIEVSRDEGLFALLDTLADRVLTPIIQEWDPDLKFVFLGLDEKDEAAEVSLRSQRIGGWQTINEARTEEGIDPISDDWADLPLPFAQQAFSSQLQSEQMKQQMEMQQQGQEQPPEGEEGEEGGNPMGDGDEGDQGQQAGQYDDSDKDPHERWQGPPEKFGPESVKSGFLSFEVVDD